MTPSSCKWSSSPCTTFPACVSALPAHAKGFQSLRLLFQHVQQCSSLRKWCSGSCRSVPACVSMLPVIVEGFPATVTRLPALAKVFSGRPVAFPFMDRQKKEAFASFHLCLCRFFFFRLRFPSRSDHCPRALVCFIKSYVLFLKECNHVVHLLLYCRIGRIKMGLL